MKKALFQPFDIGKWFILGFTAFLATLADCQGNGGGNYSTNNRTDWDEFFNFPQTAWDWLTSHPLYFNLIILGVILLFVIGIVFTWLSSRGKFMFLDNVVYDKAKVAKPWREYRKEGNSLFLWRFLYGLIVFAGFILLFIYCFKSGKNLYYEGLHGITVGWAILKMILLFLAYLIIVSYINTFLDHFVVPIMYKNRISAVRGWNRFLKLFSRHLGHFIVYGLFVFILGIAVILGIIIVCICTCCIGFLLLVIPYINAVALLPVHYTFRAFSVEFLEQFGDDYKLFPKSEESGVESQG